MRISKCFNDNSTISRWSEMLRLNTPIECPDDLLISPVPAFTVSNMIYDWIYFDSKHHSYLVIITSLLLPTRKTSDSHLQRDTDLVRNISTESLQIQPLYKPVNPCLTSNNRKYIIDLDKSIHNIFEEKR